MKTFWGTTKKRENKNLSFFKKMQLFKMHGTGRVNLPLFFKIIMWSCVCEYLNKKSDWLPISASKLLRELSGIIKMPNYFFGQYLQKRSKTEKWPLLSNFTYSSRLVIKFQIECLDQIYPKRVFPTQKRKKGKSSSSSAYSN